MIPACQHEGDPRGNKQAEGQQPPGGNNLSRRYVVCH
jgi:hypothetical protein